MVLIHTEKEILVVFHILVHYVIIAEMILSKIYSVLLVALLFIIFGTEAGWPWKKATTTTTTQSPGTPDVAAILTAPQQCRSGYAKDQRGICRRIL